MRRRRWFTALPRGPICGSSTIVFMRSWSRQHGRTPMRTTDPALEQIPIRVRRRPAYRVDWVTGIMLAGSILDVCSTWVVVSRPHGFELNPVLGPLIRHSLVWIPIYLLCRPLLVPLLPEMCRLGFGIFFGLT